MKTYSDRELSITQKKTAQRPSTGGQNLFFAPLYNPRKDIEDKRAEIRLLLCYIEWNRAALQTATDEEREHLHELIAEDEDNVLRLETEIADIEKHF